MRQSSRIASFQLASASRSSSSFFVAGSSRSGVSGLGPRISCRFYNASYETFCLARCLWCLRYWASQKSCFFLLYILLCSSSSVSLLWSLSRRRTTSSIYTLSLPVWTASNLSRRCSSLHWLRIWPYMSCGVSPWMCRSNCTRYV